LISLILALVLWAAHSSQDPVIVTGGRNLSSTDHIMTLSGLCGDDRVSVSVQPEHQRIWVRIAERTAYVSDDDLNIGTGPGGRHIARTYLLCGREGGLEIHFVFAEARDQGIVWTRQVLTITPDLTVANVGPEQTMTAEQAAADFR
jgi:hypothetical protein